MLGQQGNGVALGITAPEDIRVDRAEVHDRRLKPAAVAEEMIACPHGGGKQRLDSD